MRWHQCRRAVHICLPCPGSRTAMPLFADRHLPGSNKFLAPLFHLVAGCQTLRQLWAQTSLSGSFLGKCSQVECYSIPTVIEARFQPRDPKPSPSLSLVLDPYSRHDVKLLLCSYKRQITTKILPIYIPHYTLRNNTYELYRH
jgi:hypothetical protein